jgi:hypothetical protein
VAENQRVFYACERAGIAPMGNTSKQFETIRGLQSANMTSTCNLEQVFEWGQLAIYENIEGVPDVEVTCEKVLDGYCPIYLLATQTDGDGDVPLYSTLSGRAQGQCIMAIGIYDETGQVADIVGSLGAEVHMSGLYVSSVGYSVSVDGNATENVTLVGNNKVWVIGSEGTGNFEYDCTAATWLDTPWTSGLTDPKAITGSGGVNRREDVLFGTGVDVCVLPTNIPGITTVSGSGFNVLSGGEYGAHIQSWNVNVDLGREELFELGRRGPYYRYVNFPVEVTNEITVITTSGDMISMTEEGIYDTGVGSCGNRYNLTDQKIKLVLCEGLVVDCGANNKQASVGVSGGDASGGNMEVTYTYTNFNDFDVTHPSDKTTFV